MRVPAPVLVRELPVPEITPETSRSPLAAFHVDVPPSTTGAVMVCVLEELFVTLPPVASVSVAVLLRLMVNASPPVLNVMFPTVVEAVKLGERRFEAALPKKTFVEAELAGAVPPQFVPVLHVLLVVPVQE